MSCQSTDKKYLSGRVLVEFKEELSRKYKLFLEYRRTDKNGINDGHVWGFRKM